jgi:glutaredoxin
LASLVFVFCHWSRAKLGFGLSLLGSVVLAGAAFHGAPQLRELAVKGELFPGAIGDRQAPVRDLGAQIQEKRESLEKLEAKYAEDGIALAKRYETLNTRRKALKNDDAAAVAEFNADAATYQAENAARKLVKDEISSTRTELEALLDQRARGAAPAGAGGAKRVVMYTTATCPACVAAKTYMAKKGIPFEEHDVNRSPEARAEFQRLGGRGVPLILVGKEKMEGFSAQRLEQLL